jgi:hypothetical protein
LPRVEVLVATGDDGAESTWAPGVLLRRTERTDGTLQFCVQYGLHGHEFVETLTGERVRQVISDDLRHQR